MKPLEEGAVLTLDYAKLDRITGVIPCAVQHADTREVILVAYVNEAALRKAVETRSAVFWSTSRNELWEKGKTSGENLWPLCRRHHNLKGHGVLRWKLPDGREVPVDRADFALAS